jgi:hypothetical protein
LSSLGLTGTQPVHDVWTHKDLAPVSTTFSAAVPRHGVVFVTIGRARQ